MNSRSRVTSSVDLHPTWTEHHLPSRRPTFVVVDSNHRAVLPLAISESTFSSTLALEGV